MCLPYQPKIWHQRLFKDQLDMSTGSNLPWMARLKPFTECHSCWDVTTLRHTDSKLTHHRLPQTLKTFREGFCFPFPVEINKAKFLRRCDLCQVGSPSSLSLLTFFCVLAHLLLYPCSRSALSAVPPTSPATCHTPHCSRVLAHLLLSLLTFFCPCSPSFLSLLTFFSVLAHLLLCPCSPSSLSLLTFFFILAHLLLCACPPSSLSLLTFCSVSCSSNFSSDMSYSTL